MNLKPIFNHFLGSLLVDEFSLTEFVRFLRKTKLMEGFVDLGEHTPENQKNMRANHALVFMFQPFQGQWRQVSFLYIYYIHKFKIFAKLTIFHYIFNRS